jgi:sulfite dehydrogenase (quinone) subunit SoeC
MHPAISVILFTVASGAGFGAVALIGAGYPLIDNPVAFFIAAFLAGALAVAGLMSSTFHLGHPERAWRALSQWRSSWLSREGVLAISALFAFGLFVLARLFTDLAVDWLGWLAALLSTLTVFATAMIYAQLKTVPHWHSALTPLVYLAFSFASGLLLVAAAGNAALFGEIPVAFIATIAVLVAWGIKVAWWQRAAATTLSSRGMTRESATGLGHIGKVSLFERPHTGANYLTREMVHRIGRKHAAKLRLIALLVGGGLPLLITAATGVWGFDVRLLGLAFVAMMAGLICERWLFFAEARHSVSLYYE